MPTRYPAAMNAMMRALAFAAVLALATAGAAVSRAGAGEMTGKARTAELARIESYLNSVTSLSARFLQIAPDGSLSHGTVLLKRPGRIKIEYDPPVPILIVADGYWLTYFDKDLGDPAYTPIHDTLAGFLVRKHIRLGGDIHVTGLEEGKGTVRLTIERTEAPEDGSLTLVFADTPLTLRQWSVRDAQGGVTHVSLVAPEFGVAIDDKVFEFSPPDRQHTIE